MTRETSLQKILAFAATIIAPTLVHMLRSILLVSLLLALAFATLPPARHPLYERTASPKDWLMVRRAPQEKMHKLTIALPAQNQDILIVSAQFFLVVTEYLIMNF